MSSDDPQHRTPSASANPPGMPAARPDGPDPDAGPPVPEATPPGDAPHKRRNVWLWISAALAVVAVGLLLWGLDTRSDLDSTEQDVAQLQADVERTQDRGGTALAALRTAADQVVAQLGATSDDLDAAVQDVEAAQQAGDEAAQKAAEAKQEAEQAVDDAADEAKAQTDQAKAEAEAARSKATVAAGCAKAYLSAFGSLLEGENVRSQVSAMRDQLGRISADCKAALAGT